MQSTGLGVKVRNLLKGLDKTDISELQSREKKFRRATGIVFECGQ